MARIRTIKPEFWQDEKLSVCDPLTRLVFLGLVSLADDAGRIVDNLRYIDAQLFMNTSDTAHEPLMRLSGMGRIKRGLTASGQPVIEIANWKRHQKIQHPNLKGALPEIVTLQEVTAIHEPLMSHSGAAHEPLTHHTNDLRPTTSTNDLTTSPAGRLRDTSAAGSGARKAKAAPKWPAWSESDRKMAHGRWCARIGATAYVPFVMALGPAFGGGQIDGASAMDLIRAYESYLSAIAAGGAGSRFASPAQCAKLLGAIVAAWHEHANDPVERVQRIERIVHGRVAA